MERTQLSEPARFRIRNATVALLSLAFTYLFFLEYLPPIRRRVRLPFDLPAFHYPFVDYAFQALRHGRFPEWDPTIYSGMPFAANVQAALFYPGTWFVFLGSLGRDHISYQALEDMVLLHVWLAFLFTYVWLVRRLSPFAAACGAGVFAFGGYLLLSLQHLGVVVGYAWIPFGLSGVDEFDDTGDWRRLYKVALASAFAFLAGYTPTWAVSVFCLLAYAVFRRRALVCGLGCVAALVVSMLLSMIQLLPAMQLSAMREAEPRYGNGLRDPLYFLSYLVPNFWNFALSTDVHTNLGREYLYLGAPGILGLLLVVILRPKSSREWSAVPFVSLLAAVAVVVTNPAGLFWKLIEHSQLLTQVIRDFYFLAGLSVALAPLAAIGMDRLLARLHSSTFSATPSARSNAIAYGLSAALVLWSLRLLYAWRWDALEKGWASAVTVTVTLVLFLAGVILMSTTTGRARNVLVAVLLLSVGIDYKAQGTRKRFNASHDDPSYRSGEMPNLQSAVYRQLRANNSYRIAIDQGGPFAQQLRHFGLTTPQGFDPFLTSAYKKYTAGLVTYRSNWEFDLSPSQPGTLYAFGVRYFLTIEHNPNFKLLSSSPLYRLLEPSDSYIKTFERLDAKPPYGWVFNADTIGVRQLTWEPERREFQMNAAAGTFYLAEQWHTGWSATIDGSPAQLNRYPSPDGPFFSVMVPSGEHRVAFRFADPALRQGAWISAGTLLVFLLALRTKRRD
ncbi:MAG: hypothetical protein ABL967_10165 [Bryobacteraceae bacterium]